MDKNRVIIIEPQYVNRAYYCHHVLGEGPDIPTRCQHDSAPSHTAKNILVYLRHEYITLFEPPNMWLPIPRTKTVGYATQSSSSSMWLSLSGAKRSPLLFIDRAINVWRHPLSFSNKEDTMHTYSEWNSKDWCTLCTVTILCAWNCPTPLLFKRDIIHTRWTRHSVTSEKPVEFDYKTTHLGTT